MPSPELEAVAALLSALLAFAAISDVRSRRIPNWTVLAVLALFAPWAFLHSGPSVAWAVAAGVLALAVGVVLYALKFIGAGDAKLFAAAALFVGLGHLFALAVVTGAAGGLVALVSMALRPKRALTMVMLRGKGDFGGGVPYGVAISVGAALVVWTSLLYPAALSDLGF